MTDCRYCSEDECNDCKNDHEAMIEHSKEFVKQLVAFCAYHHAGVQKREGKFVMSVRSEAGAYGLDWDDLGRIIEMHTVKVDEKTDS